MASSNDMDEYSEEMYEKFIEISYMFEKKYESYRFSDMGCIYRLLYRTCRKVADLLLSTYSHPFKEASLAYSIFIDNLLNDIDEIIMKSEDEYSTVKNILNKRLDELYDINDKFGYGYKVGRTYI